MPYLRLLTNALVAGAVGAAMLAHVVLLLNPQLPLRPGVVFSIGWRVLASAGGVLTAGFFIASLLRYQATHRSPGWLSLRLLAWMTTLVVGLGGLLAWLNLSAFEASLSADAARRFAVATGALVATAGVLLLIALVHYSFGRHGSRVGGSLYAIAVVAAVTLPLVARGVGEPVPPPVGVARAVAPSVRERPAGRVWLVLLDGASLDYVSPAAAQGRLPQLGRLLDAGASVTLFSIEPREPAPIWASVATGRYPSGSGVASSERYRAGYAHLDLLPRYVFADALRHLRLIRTEPVDRASLRGTPLWSILEASELSAGIAGWPFARHASSDHGFVLDDMPGSTRDPADADRRLRERFEDALVSHDVQLGSVRYAVLSAL
ncbi:MAG: alkaline phosphatase family protein, partial [Acidobacteria bacterium]|nr:alkaline phosphatase family protein [Acidobacteriota bacterium]